MGVALSPQSPAAPKGIALPPHAQRTAVNGLWARKCYLRKQKRSATSWTRSLPPATRQSTPTTPETLRVVYDDLTVNCVTLRHLRDSQSPQTRSPGPTTTPIALQTAETSKTATWPPHILKETPSTSPQLPIWQHNM